MSQPAVTVLICVHNAEDFLRETLDSVFAQTHRDFEVIAVDDGSTDRSAELLRSCRDPRLRVVRQPNGGAPAAMNAGLRIAQGAYVALLDHDDVWAPEYLAAHVELLDQSPTIDLSFSWFQVIDQDGVEIGVHSTRHHGTLEYRELLADFVIGATSNVVVRRKALEQAGLADESLPRLYDAELFLRVALLRRANMLAIPRDLMYYRWHRNQISRDLNGLIREHSKLLDKVARLSPADFDAVGSVARSNIRRYLARSAYECSQYRTGLRLLRTSFTTAPANFLKDSRHWWTLAACLSGQLLPRPIHRRLERLAGLRSARSSRLSPATGAASCPVQ